MIKKLNNKGFTLVELLAVIVILAIVVGITIPVVLTTTDNAKKKAFATAADTAADWIDRQYSAAQADLTGMVTVDTAFTTVCGNNGSNCKAPNSQTVAKDTPEGEALIAAAGLKTSNVYSINIKVNASGRSCVTLTAADDGDYVGKGDNDTDTKTGGNC